MAQRFTVQAIRDAWYVYSLDACRFDIARRVIDTGHTTNAAYAADLPPLSRAAYDAITARRACGNNRQMAKNGAQRPVQGR